MIILQSSNHPAVSVSVSQVLLQVASELLQAQKKLVPHEADQWMSHQAQGWAVTFHNLTCDLQQKLGERIAESSTNAIRSSGTKSLAERTEWNCDLQQWTPLRGSCMLANESPSEVSESTRRCGCGLGPLPCDVQQNWWRISQLIWTLFVTWRVERRIGLSKGVAIVITRRRRTEERVLCIRSKI